jgi:hypothetical protein
MISFVFALSFAKGHPANRDLYRLPRVGRTWMLQRKLSALFVANEHWPLREKFLNTAPYEGDKSKVICSHWQTLVSTTFRFRDGMLMAICDSCGRDAGIPPQPLR